MNYVPKVDKYNIALYRKIIGQKQYSQMILKQFLELNTTSKGSRFQYRTAVLTELMTEVSNYFTAKKCRAFKYSVFLKEIHRIWLIGTYPFHIEE